MGRVVLCLAVEDFQCFLVQRVFVFPNGIVVHKLQAFQVEVIKPGFLSDLVARAFEAVVADQFLEQIDSQPLTRSFILRGKRLILKNIPVGKSLFLVELEREGRFGQVTAFIHKMIDSPVCQQVVQGRAQGSIGNGVLNACMAE